MTCASTIVCAVVGPTASGKSDLALELAVRLPWALGARGAGEIVSADALQLYRGMDVGTAKTPVAERRGIAHHQIDVLDVRDEDLAVGQARGLGTGNGTGRVGADLLDDGRARGTRDGQDRGGRVLAQALRREGADTTKARLVAERCV